MRFVRWGALIGLVAVSSGAQASVVLRLSDEALTAGADVIVRGQVVAARCRLGERTIVTDYTIRVEESLKGDAGRFAVVTEMGGRIGETHHVVPGAPAYRVGARVVAYLFRHDGELSTYGMAQGLFFVQALPDTGEEVLVRSLEETSLASPDVDGVIRPHPEETQATESPRRIADLRALALRFATPVR
jgi:hypothetical protein